LTCITSNRLFN